MSGDNVLRQEHLNHVLFEGISNATLVNMTKSRDDAVVEQMLRLREQGDHPSLISTTSRFQHGHGGTSPRSEILRRSSPTTSAAPQYPPPRPRMPSPAQPSPSMWNEPEEAQRMLTPPQSAQSFPRVPLRQSGPPVLTPSAFDMPPSVIQNMSPGGFTDMYGAALGRVSPAGSLRSQRLAASAPASVVQSPIQSRFAAQPSKFAELTRQHMDRLNAPVPAPYIAPAAAANTGIVSVAPPPPKHREYYQRRRSSRLSAVESSVTHQRESRRQRSRSRSRSSSAHERRKTSHRKGGRAYRYELTLELKNLKVPFNEEEDSTSDLEFILDRTLSVREKQKRVDNIRKGVGFVTFFLEKVLVKVFPSLRLDGWSASLMEELASDTHEDTLEQVYRKTFRHGPSNVWLSLAIIVLGTAAKQGKANASAASAAPGASRASGGGFNMIDIVTGFLGMGGGAKKKAAASNAAAPTPKAAAVAATAQTAAAASRRKRMAPAEI